MNIYINLINKVNEVTLEYEEALKTVQMLNNEFKSIMEANESRNAERAEVLSQRQKENIKSGEDSIASAVFMMIRSALF